MALDAPLAVGAAHHVVHVGGPEGHDRVGVFLQHVGGLDVGPRVGGIAVDLGDLVAHHVLRRGEVLEGGDDVVEVGIRALDVLGAVAHDEHIVGETGAVAVHLAGVNGGAVLDQDVHEGDAVGEVLGVGHVRAPFSLGRDSTASREARRPASR